MKIIESINRADDMCPNAFTQDDKIGWLSELDGKIKAEIIDTHEGSEDYEFSEYTTDDLEKDLIVSFPYDVLYVKYLEAQIHYANGDIGKYSNSMAMFNEKMDEFTRYYNRHNMPKGTKHKYF